MVNVQFEQEKYSPSIVSTGIRRPWFVRLISSFGLAENDNQASIFSFIFIILITGVSIVMFMRINWQPEIPQELRNIQNYRQELYSNL